MTLAEIKVGQDAVLRTIGGQGELRHHLLDMGLTPGTEVTLRKVAPMGDPIEVELRGYELTLRLDDAAKIEVENVHETDRAARSEERHTAVPHPGVGELRKAPSYHDRKSGAVFSSCFFSANHLYQLYPTIINSHLLLFSVISASDTWSLPGSCRQKLPRT